MPASHCVMSEKNENSWFSDLLLAWYADNGRQLPWRETKDPYKIWISEVVLQQTRVEQGLPYYLRFVERFPTVVDLAEASEDEVLKHWQGLGYYSRARNLHAAAKQISTDRQGNIPDTYEGLRAMKGVGDYTAADIAALAYGLPHAAIDGNGYRVLSRVFGIDTPIDSTRGKKEFAQLGAELVSQSKPGEFNQGLMDLGATVCTPKNPQCESCPLTDKCHAQQHNKWQELPVKEKKTKVHDRFFYYFHITLPDGRILVKQRKDKDIWIGLFDYPMVESQSALEQAELFSSKEFKQLKKRMKGLTVTGEGKSLKHQLSHQTLHTTLYYCQAEKAELKDNEQAVEVDEFNQLAIPRLIELLGGKK